MAAINARGGNSAVSPGKALTPDQQEQQERASQEARRKNRGKEILEIDSSYKEHEKNIDELFRRFKSARDKKISPYEIGVCLKNFQEEQMRIEKCLKNLSIIKDNIGKYKFGSSAEWYREIVKTDLERYSELVKHAEEMFMDECKGDIEMGTLREKIVQAIQLRKPVEDS